MTDRTQADGAATVWTETDSEHFIDYGAYFVPEREVQIDTIRRVIPTPSSPANLVELCCGEGLLAEALATYFPTATIHAFDGSAAMLDATATRLARFSGRFVTHQFDLEASDWRDFEWPVHAIVSSLAVHHLDGAGKAALFRDLSAALVPGGTLVICDLVEPLTDEAKAVYARHWDDGVRDRALQLDGNLDKFEFFRADQWNHYSAPEPDPVDQPSPLFDQLKWMEAAGLTRVDVHWLKAGHAIFSGRKP